MSIKLLENYYFTNQEIVWESGNEEMCQSDEKN